MSKPPQYQAVYIDNIDQRIREEYTGCCICHVTKGTRIVGILGLILDIIVCCLVFAILFSSPQIEEEKTWDKPTLLGVGTLSFCGILVHGLVLYGLSSEKTWAFVPYLIVKAIEIICLILSGFGIGTSFINSVKIISWAGQGTNIFSLFVVILVKIWFWQNIWKTYRYFKRQ